MHPQRVQPAMKERGSDRGDHVERWAGGGDGAADGGDDAGGDGNGEERTDTRADETGHEVEEEGVESLVEHGTQGEAGGGEGGPHRHAGFLLDDGAVEGGRSRMRAEVDLGEGIPVDLVSKLMLGRGRHSHPLHCSSEDSRRS
eukprot:752378-Hanusia_phi.AAC.2